MFNKTKGMGKKVELEINSVNRIANKTEIKGDIKSEGDIRIDGKLIGNIDTKGKIIIGATGLIEGEIKCRNARIDGKLDGKITITELIEISSTGKVNGEIITSEISIEPGAMFTGSCKMDNNAKPYSEKNTL